MTVPGRTLRGKAFFFLWLEFFFCRKKTTPFVRRTKRSCQCWHEVSDNDPQKKMECTIDTSTLTHRQVQSHHVYTGMCDAQLTRWVTVSPWNGFLRFTNEGRYEDADGHDVLVYEDDEDEFGEWEE